MKKNTRKIALALVIVMMLLMSLATIPTFAEPSSSEITVYFKNNWLWTDVRCHYWGEDFSTVWEESIPMTVVDNDGTYDIYSISIPSNVTGIVIHGIKDDGSGNRDQTPDIVTGLVDGAGWCMEWADGNAVLPFAYDGTSGDSGNVYEPQDTYLYLKNDAGWENVYFYCWNLDGGTMEQWPGEPMTAVGDGYYVAFLPGNLNYTYMKFSDGASNESAQLTIPYGGDTLYNNSTRAWSEAPDIDLSGTPVVGDKDNNTNDDVNQPDDGGNDNQPQKKGFFAKIWQGIANFFKSIGNFFKNIFGGKKK